VDILIVYGTSEGQTRKVATFLADRFSGQSHAVQLVDAADVPKSLDPATYDAIIVAARVHASTYPRSVRRFVKRHRAALEARPSAFVSVSMLAAMKTAKTEAAIAGYVDRFIKATGWQPAHIHQAAGGRPYTRHNALGRWILGRIDSKAWGKPVDTSRDYEWTDWEALRAFADAFLASAAAAPASATA
jgi:menaquinone-dependent protoporphyrinogen oxidase